MFGASGAPGLNRPELFEEVKLGSTARERERYDNLAELYAVIRALDSLERAYTKDIVNQREYHEACTRLLIQYKQAFKQVKDSVDSVEAFIDKYKMVCPAALERIREDKPLKINIEQETISKKMVADLTTHLITAMDVLKLEQKSIDQIQPYLRDINILIKQMEGFDGNKYTEPWISTMSSMQASDELDDLQVRQLLHDLEQVYSGFNHFLAHGPS